MGPSFHFFSSARPLFTFKLHLLKQFLNISLDLWSVSFKLQYEHTCRPSYLYFWSTGNCAIYVHKTFAHLFLLRASVFLHDSSFLQFIIFILEYSVPQTILHWAVEAASPQDYIEKFSVLPTATLEGRYQGSMCYRVRVHACERRSVYRDVYVFIRISTYISLIVTVRSLLASQLVTGSRSSANRVTALYSRNRQLLGLGIFAFGCICCLGRMRPFQGFINFNMLNSDHPKILSPTPWNLEILFGKEDFAGGIQDFEMRGLLWIIQVDPKFHHKLQQLLPSALIRERQRAMCNRNQRRRQR